MIFGVKKQQKDDLHRPPRFMSATGGRRSPVWFYATIVLSFLMTLSGLTGIVDGLVEWRDSIRPMIELYTNTRNWLLALLPFRAPAYVADYLLVGAANVLSVRVLFQMAEIRARDRLDRLLPKVSALLLWPVVWVYYGYIFLLRRAPEFGDLGLDALSAPRDAFEVLSQGRLEVGENSRFWRPRQRHIRLYFKIFATLLAAWLVLLFLAVDVQRQF